MSEQPGENLVWLLRWRRAGQITDIFQNLRRRNVSDGQGRIFTHHTAEFD
jgi:hypothetical protein